MPAVMMDLLHRVKRVVDVVATTAGSVAKEAVQDAASNSGAPAGPTTVAPGGGDGTTSAPRGIDKLKNLVQGELSKRMYILLFVWSSGGHLAYLFLIKLHVFYSKYIYS
jgi:hypothetical protein